MNKIRSEIIQSNNNDTPQKKPGYLILTRRVGERITIGEDAQVVFSVLGINPNGNLKIGIEAPKGVPVWREEIYLRMKAQGQKDFICKPHSQYKKELELLKEEQALCSKTLNFSDNINNEAEYVHLQIANDYGVWECNNPENLREKNIEQLQKKQRISSRFNKPPSTT